MRVLISEKLSEHKYKTPEGYLICTDAILARTGKQTYTRDELFGDGDSTEVNVDRPYNEVMNEKTIASFENKPVTFDHPEEDVNIGNYKSYAVGYVRDVRQGKVDGKDVILGNLVITDKDAIDAIESGDHTDLSCGYDCDIRDDGNGNYAQNNIRGNHVALCREGRAGMARIVDSKVKNSIEDSRIEKVAPELLLNLNAWLEDKTYIERKYNVKIYNITSNRGLTVTGSRQNLEKLYKDYHLEEGYNLKIVDSKVKDSNYIYEFYYNDIDNEDKRMMRKYNLEVVGKSGKGRGQRNLAVKGSLENLKRYAEDYLGYELHPNYLIPESQFAYDMYDSAKDNKTEDAGDHSWFKGYINGDLQSFNINSLISSVKSRKRPLHANLAGKSGNVYTVFIDGSLESNVDEGSNMSIDIIAEYPDKQQKRLISKDFNSWNECQNIFNTFKSSIRDSKMRDWTPEEVRQFKVERRGGGYGVYYKGQLVSKYNDYDKYGAEEELKRLRKYYYVDSRMNDSGYTYKGYDLIDFGNVIAVQKDGRTLVKCPTEAEAEKWVDEHISAFGDSKKGMTASDAIKMLNIVNAYKKVKDADADEWVIKNTGLTYEVWNDNKMVKKFPTKRQAVEWIRGRFPSDKITEA